jgi:hypothetical protein
MTNVGIGKALGDCISMIASTLQPGERIVYLEDDQSRFDMHMGEHTFRFLYKLYDQATTTRSAYDAKREVSWWRLPDKLRPQPARNSPFHSPSHAVWLV